MSRYVIRNNDLPGDTVAINAEPGMKLPNGKETSPEFVMNSNATAMFGPILEKMNRAIPRHYSENNFALGQEGKAHESINMLMVKSSLANMLPQDNSPVKMEANEFASFPIADSPVRQRVDATRQMQEGGKVSKTIRGARPLEYNYDDPEMLRGMFSVPASEVGGGEGLRYYSAEKAQGRMPSLDRSVVQSRAIQKMAYSPADSIPQAMVEGYFDKPSKASGFLKRLGINKQEGGEVEEGRSVRDYLGSLQENYQKYQGDVMTEAGDSRFNPSGQFTREGFAEEYNFPLEEAKFDTLYGYGTPGARDAAININLPNRKIKHTSHMNTDKYGEFQGSERRIEDQMMKEHQGSYIDLGTMMGGDYSEAIEAEEAGYLDMGPFEQTSYSIDKSKEREAAKPKPEESPEYRKKMMEGLGIKSDEEYDAFLEFKRKYGGYQQGGPVRGYQNGGQIKSARQEAQDSLMATSEYDDIKAEDAKKLQVMAMLDSLNQGGGEKLRTPEGGGGRSDDSSGYSPSFDERFNMWEQTGQGVESSRARQLRMAKVPADNYSGEDVVKNIDSLKHYFRSFGRLKTPLQEKNEFLYNRLGVDPENPPMQLQGLKGRALLQRYGNEVQ